MTFPFLYTRTDTALLSISNNFESACQALSKSMCTSRQSYQQRQGTKIQPRHHGRPSAVPLYKDQNLRSLSIHLPQLIWQSNLRIGLRRRPRGEKLQYLYTTHAHGDHFFGNPVLLKHFPEAICVATSSVVEGIKQHLLNRLAMWQMWFPNGQIPDGQIIPNPLPANGEFYVDGQSFFGVNVVHSDTHASSFLHVPSLKLVVAGDIVYGDCFQFLAEANTAEKRISLRKLCGSDIHRDGMVLFWPRAAKCLSLISSELQSIGYDLKIGQFGME